MNPNKTISPIAKVYCVIVLEVDVDKKIWIEN